MSPRLKLKAAAAPLVMAGALWCASAATTPAYPGSQHAPPPCGPDGVCLPRPETFGWYETRWRPFPGDVIGVPTPADKARIDEEEIEEQLGGPQLPESSKEGQVGPDRPERKAPENGEDAPDDGIIEPLPGVGPAPGVDPLPGLDTLPGAEPQPGPAPSTLDAEPLGAQPPTPPAWLRKPAATNAKQASLPAATGAGLAPLPAAPAPSTPFEAIKQRPAPVLDGPNLYGDDAPPALPASLQRVSRGGPQERPAQERPAWLPGALNYLPPVQQPASIRPLDANRVIQASSVEPLGMRVINAAGPDQTELQQAIYYEASDQTPPAK